MQNKKRWYPNKKQNNYPSICSYFEDHNGLFYCQGGETNAAKICKGNPHNCIKTKYHREASKSDKRKNAEATYNAE